ncbi:unnamed protein product [Penicillium salamii]|uniref:Uncharacterized protein n=1 Tax=Penicillium salamii TaxID=1612424 RepID=A0A9W4NY70_9EURO|nr:unnamed protein product [Penicillium salamii]CAG8210518.1 unnamed protein product [Penicillium salamii]CAG8210798.1 unnamed protein product [Penicillium salamii]CAG8213471.1 unnamed protein product [Penicillium salamii]CAG8258134.1 unnamed protein product [Penicillium salamii]
MDLTTNLIKQSNTTKEKNKTNYTLRNNILQKEHNILNLNKTYSKYFPPIPFRINTISLILEPSKPPQTNSPKLYLNNTTSATKNYPNYPKEVTLHPSS